MSASHAWLSCSAAEAWSRIQSLPPTEQAEAKALLARLTVPSPLLTEFGQPWLREVSPTWTWDWPHLVLMREYLNRVERGEINRLMFFCPPRHGKSEQNTVRWAAYLLEKYPHWPLIIGAYNQILANRFSRKIRRIVAPRVPLSVDLKAVEDWETQQGGGVRAVGVGGGITGRGGRTIIIDDPVKNREEADSEAFRERVWEWYTDDLWTRQEPGCAIVLTMTRWHEDDLAGRLLAAQAEGGEQWTVVNLPALAEADDPLGRTPGAPLCPDRYDVDFFEAARRQQGRNFYALYQGRPTAAEGAVFKSEWFRRWRLDEAGNYLLEERRVAQEDVWVFQTVDLAASEKTSADYSVIGTWGVTPRKELLLLDVWREREEGPEVKSAIRAARARWRPVFQAIERNGLGLPIVQDLQREGLPIRGVQTHRDKHSRTVGAAAHYEAGRVYHRESAPWLAALEAELLAAPLGAHDDQRDVVALATEAVGGGQTGILHEFNYARHSAECEFDEGRPLVCGWWFRPVPACVIVQLDRWGCCQVLYAAVGERVTGVYEFSQQVRDDLQRHFGEVDALDTRHYSHPDWTGHGDGVSAADAPWRVIAQGVEVVTGWDEERGKRVTETRPGTGWRLLPAEASLNAMLEPLRARLTQLVDGQSAFVVDTEAGVVSDALAGGFCYAVHPNGTLSNKPEENQGYAVVGALACAVSRLFAVRPKSEESRGPAWQSTTRAAGRRDRW